ncbi:MAG: transcription termination/antitermination protein NusG [Treponema sp.]|nr:transcription termination/antitermination protein NusG [Treponema sp.]
MSRNWYILHTYTGYEAKIERTVRSLVESNDLDSNIILDIKVPVEEITEVKDGKKKVRKDYFLPGYVMVEMDLPELGWKDVCAKLYRIQGVTGFVGCVSRKDRPIPISSTEAKNLLQRSGAIKGEKPTLTRLSFSVGDTVKINDGPFVGFNGVVKEINLEKEKLTLEVQIFGRASPLEVGFTQVKKE